MVRFPSSNPVRFSPGEKVTVQVWDDDTTGDDLLAEAEAEDVIVACDHQFFGLTPVTKRKYYDYSFEAKFYAFACCLRIMPGGGSSRRPLDGDLRESRRPPGP